MKKKNVEINVRRKVNSNLKKQYDQEIKDAQEVPKEAFQKLD